MIDKQIQEIVELFLKSAYIEYHEILKLIRYFLPERADFIIRILNGDIQQFKLKVYFWEVWEHRGSTPLLEPEYVTPENIGYLVHPYHDQFWLFGDFSTSELKAWLQDKNFANALFEEITNKDSNCRDNKLPEFSDTPTVTGTDTPPQNGTNSTVEAVPLLPDEQLKRPPIIVPSVLWQGKSPASARDAMRHAELSDAVIAYVLYNWCALTNKTQLGRVLGNPDMDDSTYRRRATRLLAEAAHLIITHD